MSQANELILNKVHNRAVLGRTHFWSHILFSMIALFALPNVQGIESPDSSRFEYQNQSLQAQVVSSTFVQQEQLQQTQTPRPIFQSEKQCEFSPHFDIDIFAPLAPIRGSPYFS